MPLDSPDLDLTPLSRLRRANAQIAIQPPDTATPATAVAAQADPVPPTDAFNRNFTVLYEWTCAATAAYLLIQDMPKLDSWNWVYIIPLDVFLGAMWPIYWMALHGLVA